MEILSIVTPVSSSYILASRNVFPIMMPHCADSPSLTKYLGSPECSTPKGTTVCVTGVTHVSFSSLPSETFHMIVEISFHVFTVHFQNWVPFYFSPHHILPGARHCCTVLQAASIFKSHQKWTKYIESLSSNFSPFLCGPFSGFHLTVGLVDSGKRKRNYPRLVIEY